ncbi:MAG: hypothetical protein ACOC5T_05060 [Elusimicrobiota bacterium]
MHKQIEQLSNIANELDSKKLFKSASKIDTISKNILKIVHAQYVGVQGYWIRNERCWSNCWRIKRAKYPDKSAQEIWQDCQNEYVKSINNPTSGWEKYADDKKKSLVKEAKKDVIDKEDMWFRDTVDKKVSQGMSFPVAVFDTIENKKKRYAHAYLTEANDLLKIAEKLQENGHEELAIKIASEANNIVKEAGIGEWMGKAVDRAGKGLWEGAKAVGRGVRDLGSKMSGGHEVYEKATNKIVLGLGNLSNVLVKHIQFMRSLKNIDNQAQAKARITQYSIGGAGRAILASVQKTVNLIGRLSNSDFGTFGKQYKQNIDNIYKTFAALYQNLYQALDNIQNDQKSYTDILQQLNTISTRAIKDFASIYQRASQVGQQAQQQVAQKDQIQAVPTEQQIYNVGGTLQDMINNAKQNPQDPQNRKILNVIHNLGLAMMSRTKQFAGRTASSKNKNKKTVQQKNSYFEDVPPEIL